MSHHVYTVRGVVLALRPIREADKSAVILTRDLGLVHGTARGVRETRSKLRSALLELALVKVSLVRGQRQWRVTTVTLLHDSTTLLRERREALAALSRVSSLLLKLVRGEEKHPTLFDKLEGAILRLLDDEATDVGAWEAWTVAHMLAELGYLSEESLSLPQKELVKAINRGIKESGLS